MVKWLAIESAKFLANLGSKHARPPPPLKAEPVVVWNVFFIYVALVIGGTSLAITLPEIIVLAPIKARHGWEYCEAVPLTALLGSEVGTGLLSSTVVGGSLPIVALQLFFVLYEAGATVASMIIATNVLMSEGVSECGTALASLVCAVLVFIENIPFVLLWMVLLNVRWHRDEPGMPLVAMHAILPPARWEKWLLPPFMRKSTLYDLDAVAEDEETSSGCSTSPFVPRGGESSSTKGGAE